MSSSVSLPSDHVVCVCRSPRRSASSTSSGSVPFARSSELAAVLAQLRRDPVVPEEAVDVLLAREVLLLAGLDDGDRVLGDGVAASNGVLAQRDVVVLRAGEVLQQVAVALGRHDAQVEARAVVRDDRRLRRPFGRDVDDQAERAEVVDERCGSVAVAMMSRSRTVSRMRRAEPASDTSTDAGCSRSTSTTARSFGSVVPSSARRGPSVACGCASAAAIFSSVPGPMPACPRSSCASAAALQRRRRS